MTTDENGIKYFPNYYPDHLVGYVYEADVHCVACASERFGSDLQLRIAGGHQQVYPYGKLDPDPPVDSEGNPVSAITGAMEFHCSLFCGDCHTDLSDQVTIVHDVPENKRKCRYCQTPIREMRGHVVFMGARNEHLERSRLEAASRAPIYAEEGSFEETNES